MGPKAYEQIKSTVEETKLCYQRESGTDNGISYGSPEYDELLKQGYQPKLALYLYELNGGLVFNKESTAGWACGGGKGYGCEF